MASPTPVPSELHPRRFLAQFAEDTPRHWCAGNPVITHILNAYTLLVPGNEGFFIRTLKQATPHIADTEMLVVIKHFSYQEGQHGAGHLRFWQILETQGYRIRGFQRRVDFVLYRLIERISPLKLKLSMASCIEHVNAYIGHEFLSQEILRDATPSLKALFEWHFAEEIEHKHVAFDVLQTISPSYLVRLLGAALVIPMFYFLSTLGTLNLLRQDKLLNQRLTWKLFRQHLWSQHHMVRRTLAHIAAYLRPSFHPAQLRDYDLAQRVLDRHSSTGATLAPPLSQVA